MNLGQTGQKMMNQPRIEQTISHWAGQGHSGAHRDRPGQTGTDWDRLGQTGTDQENLARMFLKEIC